MKVYRRSIHPISLAYQSAIIYRSTVCLLFLFNYTMVFAAEKDLLYNCTLSQAKASYVLDTTNNLLVDKHGWIHEAKYDKKTITARREKKWDDQSAMYYTVFINRETGKLNFRVEQWFFKNHKASTVIVDEDGRCTPEKIHPRHLLPD
mgnify:CR=1 FL=1